MIGGRRVKQAAVFRTVAVKMLVVMLVVTPAALAQQPKTPADIPVEAFAALPGFSKASISPDGDKMAYFVELDGQREVMVQHLDGSNAFRVPPPKGSNFSDYRWANNGVILFQSRMTLKRRVFRSKTQETRWFSLNLDNTEFTWLGKPKRRSDEHVSQYEHIVDMLPDDPDHILMEMDMQLDGMAEVYQVDVRSGRRAIRKGNSRGIQNWFTDNNSVVRLGNGYDGSKWVAKLKNSDGKWMNLKKTDWAKRYNVKGFSNKPNTLYVSGLSSHGTEGLFELNIDTGEIVDQVFVHDSVDLDSAFEDTATGKIKGVYYTDDYTRIKYLDKNMIPMQRGIDKALPDSINTILGHIKSRDWYFIFVASDRNPGGYYLYDRPNRKLSFVASLRAQVNPELMASVEPVNIPTRDGEEIPGYMIVPNGKEAQHLPTIVMPHGGPFGVRDTAEWDYEAQFYASRGYLVLKPNFRGSGGYGPAFEVAGYNQWGGLMQDDVTDSTNWLIKNGYSDPERICIVGNSYGGYAALMGVIKEPGLYKCAISVNGVTNLVRLKSGDKSNSIGGRSWTKRMGLKGVKDKEVSPHHRAEEVSAPVLLMSSVDDARVPWKMSRDMHKRLEKLKKESTYVKIKDGTHHMVTAQSRLAALKAAEKFLAKHLGK